MHAVPAPIPANEQARLAAVQRTGLMGSTQKARFDIHTQLVRHIADVPVAYLGLIDEARQYFLSENFTGCMTNVAEVARDQTLCQHALNSSQPIIVPDLRDNPTFTAHPLVMGDPFWVFWAGFPLITAEGYVLGTICAVDFVPRSLSQTQIDLLRGVAADVTLSIQMQADQQERIAQDCNAIILALTKAGLQNLDEAAAFLDLCQQKPVQAARSAGLIALGLAQSEGDKISLTAAGNSLKSGSGLGPAAYKSKTSAIRDTDLLDAMFTMIS